VIEEESGLHSRLFLGSLECVDVERSSSPRGQKSCHVCIRFHRLDEARAAGDLSLTDICYRACCLLHRLGTVKTADTPRFVTLGGDRRL
jgi:hypothetical protein